VNTLHDVNSGLLVSRCMGDLIPELQGLLNAKYETRACSKTFGSWNQQQHTDIRKVSWLRNKCNIFATFPCRGKCWTKSLENTSTPAFIDIAKTDTSHWNFLVLQKF
jgi:hypothetical protein